MSPSELVFGKRVDFDQLLQVKSNQNLGVGLFGEVRVVNKIDQSTWMGRVVLFIRSLYVTEMTEKVNEVAAKVLSNNMYRMGIFLRTHGWQTLDQAVKTDILSRVTTILENQLNEKNPKSLYERGLSIELGFKGTADIEKAVDEYYLPAAEQGYAPALIRLGELYQGGLVKVDEEEMEEESALAEAFTCFRDAVEHGANDGKAFYNLALCYSEGKGTEVDIFKALEFYQKAAELGNRDAENKLPEATLKVGLAYRDGLYGAEVDEAKGFQYIKEAAYEHNAIAQNELAICCEKGLGCEKNLSLARTIYALGDARGNTDATYNYGVLLFEGIGGDVDKEGAFKKFQAAAKVAHAQAQEYAGYCLLKGEGVAQDEAAGVKYLSSAAKQGVASASYQLGEYYLDKKDYVKAAQYLREAGARGSEEAPVKLLYDLPEAIFQDVIEATMKGVIRLDSAKQSAAKFIDSIGKRMQQSMP